MARSRSPSLNVLRVCVPALLALAPASAVAQDAAMTPEAASAALSQLGSIFLANHTGFGRTGVFNTKDGRWVQHPERGLTYVCNVEAAVIPTTPGAQTGVAYGTQVSVFVDPDSGRVRIEGGNSSGWSRTDMTVDDLRERFPSEPPPPEPAVSEEDPGPEAPGNEPPDGSDFDPAGGLLGILADELIRIASERVAVADIPPQVPDAPVEPPAPPTSGDTPPTAPPTPPPDDSPEPPVAPPPPDDTPPPPGTDSNPPPPERGGTEPEPPPRGGLDGILDEHDPGSPPDDGQSPPCHVRQPGEVAGIDDCTDEAVIGEVPGGAREFTGPPSDEEIMRQYEEFMNTMQQMGPLPEAAP